MALIIKEMKERDYEAFRRLFEDAYAEYLEFLKVKTPQQYQKERRERREVSHARFNHYLKTGSSFVAEEDGRSSAMWQAKQSPLCTEWTSYSGSNTSLFSLNIGEEGWAQLYCVDSYTMLNAPI